MCLSLLIPIFWLNDNLGNGRLNLITARPPLWRLWCIKRSITRDPPHGLKSIKKVEGFPFQMWRREIYQNLLAISCHNHQQQMFPVTIKITCFSHIFDYCFILREVCGHPSSKGKSAKIDLSIFAMGVATYNAKYLPFLNWMIPQQLESIIYI